MADKENMEDGKKLEKIEKLSGGVVRDDRVFIEKLSDFLQKNRALILGCCITLVGALVVFIAITVALNAMNAKALREVAALDQRYETLRFDIADESKRSDVDALLVDLNAFAANHKSYAGARACELAASIHSDLKNWAEAAPAWGRTAEAAKGTYLEPIALYNQAVALEEQNDAQGAADLLARAAAFDDFPGASRAQFNAARVQEDLDKNVALETYRSLVGKWPNDMLWTPLAQSRIIALELR